MQDLAYIFNSLELEHAIVHVDESYGITLFTIFYFYEDRPDRCYWDLSLYAPNLLTKLIWIFQLEFS